MTSLSRIFFKLATSVALACAIEAADVRGTVKLDGLGAKRRDFSGVVVWLDPVSGHSAPAAPRNARMLQKGKMFLPHVLAIPVNSTVDFPNADPIFHNAFSNFSGQVFDVGLYPPGTSRSVKFRREGVVRVFCNIHPTMSAAIVVLRSPHFAVSDSKGAFVIDNVPPGAYTLRVFHERALESTLKALEQRVTIQGDHSLGEIAITEAGYIAAPHKNKFGQDYPKVIDEGLPYGGRTK
jgi:plastocyanin